MENSKEKHLKLPGGGNQVVFHGAMTLALRDVQGFRLMELGDERESTLNRKVRVSKGRKVR